MLAVDQHRQTTCPIDYTRDGGFVRRPLSARAASTPTLYKKLAVDQYRRARRPLPTRVHANRGARLHINTNARPISTSCGPHRLHEPSEIVHDGRCKLANTSARLQYKRLAADQYRRVASPIDSSSVGGIAHEVCCQHGRMPTRAPSQYKIISGRPISKNCRSDRTHWRREIVYDGRCSPGACPHWRTPSQYNKVNARPISTNSRPDRTHESRGIVHVSRCHHWYIHRRAPSQYQNISGRPHAFRQSVMGCFERSRRRHDYSIPASSLQHSTITTRKDAPMGPRSDATRVLVRGAQIRSLPMSS